MKISGVVQGGAENNLFSSGGDPVKGQGVQQVLQIPVSESFEAKLMKLSGNIP